MERVEMVKKFIKEFPRIDKKRVKAELDKYGENEIKGIDGSCRVYEHSF